MIYDGNVKYGEYLNHTFPSPCDFNHVFVSLYPYSIVDYVNYLVRPQITVGVMFCVAAYETNDASAVNQPGCGCG